MGAFDVGTGRGVGRSAEGANWGPSNWGELPEGWNQADLAAVAGVIAGELAARGNLRDAALIADVISNRANQPAKQYGFNPTQVALSTQFSTNINKGKTKSSYALNQQVARAVIDRAYYDKAPKNIQAKANLTTAAIRGVYGTKEFAGIARGATFYDNKAVTQKAGTAKEHRAMEKEFGSFKEGQHTFTGTPKEGFNVNASFNVPDSFAKAGFSPTYDGISLGPFGLGGWQDQQAALANAQATPAPDVSTGSFYGGNVPPDFSLADLGGIPDRSIGSFYGNSYPDITDGITHGVADQSMGSFYGDSYPDITSGILDGQPQTQTANVGPYAFGDNFTPDRTEIGRSVYDGGAFDYGVQAEAPKGPSLSELGIGTVGMQGPAAFSYDPAVASQATIGASSVPGQMAANPPALSDIAKSIPDPVTTSGITGYKEETHTRDVPNPAFAEWGRDFSKQNALQDAYRADEMDRHGPARPTNVPDYNALGPKPPETVKETYTTRSPVYGERAAPTHSTRAAAPVERPAAVPDYAAAPLASAPPRTGEFLSDLFGSLFGPPIETPRTPWGFGPMAIGPATPVGGSWGGSDSWGGFGAGFGGQANGSSIGLGPTSGGSWSDAIAAGLADIGGGGQGGAAAGGGFGGGFGGNGGSDARNDGSQRNN